jgi:hypothetical protein
MTPPVLLDLTGSDFEQETHTRHLQSSFAYLWPLLTFPGYIRQQPNATL